MSVKYFDSQTTIERWQKIELQLDIVIWVTTPDLQLMTYFAWK